MNKYIVQIATVAAFFVPTFSTANAAGDVEIIKEPGKVIDATKLLGTSSSYLKILGKDQVLCFTLDSNRNITDAYEDRVDECSQYYSSINKRSVNHYMGMQINRTQEDSIHRFSGPLQIFSGSVEEGKTGKTQSWTATDGDNDSSWEDIEKELKAVKLLKASKATLKNFRIYYVPVNIDWQGTTASIEGTYTTKGSLFITKLAEEDGTTKTFFYTEKGLFPLRTPKVPTHARHVSVNNSAVKAKAFFNGKIDGETTYVPFRLHSSVPVDRDGNPVQGKDALDSIFVLSDTSRPTAGNTDHNDVFDQLLDLAEENSDLAAIEAAYAAALEAL